MAGGICSRTCIVFGLFVRRFWVRVVWERVAGEKRTMTCQVSIHVRLVVLDRLGEGVGGRHAVGVWWEEERQIGWSGWM
jgi:hypothetical protein